jgi:hypothetical protein
MKLSDDKVSHLTHVVLKGLIEKKAIIPAEEEGTIRREMKRIIMKELQLAQDIDDKVTNKLQSYSKKIYEGSSEWDVLYHKFYEEESAKKGRDTV